MHLLKHVFFLIEKDYCNLELLELLLGLLLLQYFLFVFTSFHNIDRESINK